MEEGQGQKRRKCRSRPAGHVALSGERKQEGNIQNGGREIFRIVVGSGETWIWYQLGKRKQQQAPKSRH